MPNTITWLGKQCLDAILPPRCIHCAELVNEPGKLCGDCWSNIRFLQSPECSCCGHPFSFDQATPDMLCGHCIENPPAYDWARAVFAYTEHSKKLVLDYKFADKTSATKLFANWMQKRMELTNDDTIDIIIPVPLHKRRLMSRKYNQAALLSHAVAKKYNAQHHPLLLKRIKNTPPQASLNKNERSQNVKGGFIIRPSYAKLLKDKHIVLVDDVMTTGSTIHECTKLLKKAGAKRVGVITLSRTIDDSAL